MSQVSYGTITIVDTNDIESITIEYAQNQDSSNPPSSGWDTARPTWRQNYFIWQRTRIHKSGTTADKDSFGAAVCLTGSTGATGSTGQSLSTTKTQYTHVASNVTITTSNHTSYTWTDNVPEYDSTKPVYWGRITNTYINPAKTEYIIYKDNGLTEAIANSVEANTNASDALDKANESNSIAIHANENAQGALSISRATQQHFWFNSTTSGSIEAGAYITDTAIDTFKSGKNGGYLLARSDGVELGRGTNKFMTLSATALNFYRPGTNTIDATLTSKGLVLSKGGIEAGTKNTTNYIYIYSDDDATNHKLTINSHEASDWRIVAGKNFGVDKAGNLYASGANIEGKITITSGSNVYTKTEADAAYDAKGAANTAKTEAINAVWNATNGYTILWNYDSFSTANNGEGYICKFDPKTGTKSDANGTAMWNGTTRTITKQMLNPNTIIPFNIPIYVVCRLSSATATTGTNYLVWYNGGWKYCALPTPSAVGGAWTWAEATDMILGEFVEPSSEAAFTDCVIFDPPRSSKQITTDTITARSAQSTANAAKTTADAAAPKTSAVAEEQYIYISKASGTSSVSGTKTWITEAGDKQNTWTTKRPTYNSSYPVLFVAKQKKVVSGTVTCTTPVKDDTTTIIDGGHITTGTIDASKATIKNISASMFTSSEQDKILNSKIEIGGRNLVWDTEWNHISTRWSDWGSPTTREIVTINGKRWLHLVTTASSYQGYSQAQDKRNGYGEIKAGDKVIISYSAYAKTAGQTCTVGCHWRNSSGTIVAQNWFPSTLTTTEKRYISEVFTIPNDAVGFNVMVGDGTANAQELWISQVKIEFGTKATDWSPAPEDIQFNAEDYADNAAFEVKTELDVTKIDVVGESTSLLDNINAISDQITLLASRINFGNITVADNLAQLNTAVSIDTTTSTVYVGDQSRFHVRINGTELGFYQSAQRVAYLNNNQLYITQSVVLQQMDLGMPYGFVNPVTGEIGKGQWSWKVHPNGETPSRNNLNLKWVG